MRDRGTLAPGYLADLNVIDYARLMLRAPRPGACSGHQPSHESLAPQVSVGIENVAPQPFAFFRTQTPAALLASRSLVAIIAARRVDILAQALTVLGVHPLLRRPAGALRPTRPIRPLTLCKRVPRAEPEYGGTQSKEKSGLSLHRAPV